MRRRDFVLASASMAGALTPFFARGATPCPPSPVGITGGTTASTNCVAGGTYSTNFDATENPISEGGRWVQQGGLTGLKWTNVRTAGGVAYGTQIGSPTSGYDDSIALLSGFSPNHRISSVVSFTGSRSSGTDTHEVELILRGNYQPNVQQLYECNLGYSGAAGWYAEIMRMNGPAGSFTNIDTMFDSFGDVRNGDVFMAEIVGNRIRSYLNGVMLREAFDSTYSTGQPGIGFFWRGSENARDFALNSISVTNI